MNATNFYYSLSPTFTCTHIHFFLKQLIQEIPNTLFTMTNINPSSHTPHPGIGPRTTTPFQAVDVGGGNQGHAHDIEATLQRQYDIIAHDLSTRGANDLDFTVPEAAIDTLMTAIGGNYSTDPTQKNARDALVEALVRCPKDEGPNFTCVELLDRCMELFHIDIQPDGTSENGAGRCGKKMSTFLRKTFDTDDEERNIKQALLIMHAFDLLEPMKILNTTDRKKSSFLVHDLSTMLLKATALINTNVPKLHRVAFSPTGEAPYALSPDKLLITTFNMVRTMVFTMSFNGKWVWMTSAASGGHNGYDFLRSMIFDKYIPHSDVLHPDRNDNKAALNGVLVRLVMDIQCALLNDGKDNI